MNEKNFVKINIKIPHFTNFGEPPVSGSNFPERG